MTNNSVKKGNNQFNKRVYGAVIVKSKLANYNADFTGAPRTLPDGTVYATDKVLKYKIRDYLEKNGEKVFVKTKYKENVNPMTLEEVYEYFFGDIDKDKLIVLKNLLSMLDVRLFGVTFAMKGSDKINLSIHGPVQISYGVNRFIDWKDSGMFTDQIGSQFASKEGDLQTTLGSQTRSFEAHYVHHFSINPKNLYSLTDQVLNEITNESNIVDLFLKKIKKDKKDVLDIVTIKKRLENLLRNDKFKNQAISKLEENNLKIKAWEKFLNEKKEEIIENFKAKEELFDFISDSDIDNLKQAFQIAVSAYDSTTKKDAENEFLMWIEMKDDTVLRNFTELTKITKENGKTKIDLKDVFTYLENYIDKISKVELYYDESFTSVPNEEWPDNIKKKTTINKLLLNFVKMISSEDEKE